MISVQSCVRGRISVPLPVEWRFRCIHVWGVGFLCTYLREDHFGAFMFEGQDFSAFSWGMTILEHSCVGGKIPVHLPEGWWFRCIHVLGVGLHQSSSILQWNHQSSHEYIDFVPLKHECTEIIIPQIGAPESYPSHMHAPKSSLLR